MSALIFASGSVTELVGARIIGHTEANNQNGSERTNKAGDK